MSDDFEATVREHAPDRWLSSMFVGDEAARADLHALYALDHELTRIPHVVKDPLMGEIRMTWWREGLEEIAEGRPVRPHPVLLALTTAKLPAPALAALADARLGDLDPPRTGEALLRHIDATDGLLMALAARRLSDQATSDQVQGAARAAALARMGADGPLIAAALKEAGRELRGLPVAAFPAVAHATLARAQGPRTGPLQARLRVSLATLSGRI